LGVPAGYRLSFLIMAQAFAAGAIRWMMLLS
jgi:hypothetical protein